MAGDGGWPHLRSLARSAVLVGLLAAAAGLLAAAAGPLAAAAAAAAPSADPGKIPMGPMGDRDIIIINRSSHGIAELYVSPSAADAWGGDRLGDNQIEKYARLNIPLGRMRDCGFDVLAVYDDQRREEIRAVNLCRNRQLTLDASGAIAPPPPPYPEQHMTLINASRLPIQQFYLSPLDAAQWGDDLLATSGVSVGEERPLTFHGPCDADVRVVFANRAAEERRGLNLCRSPTLRIAPGWTTADGPDMAVRP